MPTVENENEKNPLIKALRSTEKSDLTDFIEYFKSLSSERREMQIGYLFQNNDKRECALMVAAEENPEAFKSLLEIMGPFKDKEVSYMNKQLRDTLFKALESQAASILPLLKAVEHIPEAEKRRLWDKGLYGHGAEDILELAAKSQPEAIIPLLNMILSAKYTSELEGMLPSKFIESIMVKPSWIKENKRALLEADFQACLNELDLHNFTFTDSGDKSSANATKALHSELSNSLKAWKKDSNAAALKKSCETAIKKHAPLIERDRNIARIITNILLCLTGIGLLVLGVKAGYDLAKGRATLGFYKTQNQELMDKVQDTARNMEKSAPRGKP